QRVRLERDRPLCTEPRRGDRPDPASRAYVKHDRIRPHDFFKSGVEGSISRSVGGQGAMTWKQLNYVSVELSFCLRGICHASCVLSQSAGDYRDVLWSEEFRLKRTAGQEHHRSRTSMARRPRTRCLLHTEAKSWF